MFKKLVIALGLSACLSAALAEDLNFGIISTEATQNLKADWQPLLDDMAKKTGFTVKAFFAPDYAGIIEGMRFNKVQVAWFGNKSAIEAVDRASGEVFAQNKIDAKSHFKVVRNANHETNALAVANKQVDVATNNSENLDKVLANFPEKHKDIRIVWTSPLIPLDPLVWRKDLPEATKAKLKDFLFNYGKADPREKEVLMKISKLSGFKESTNAQLVPIRQLDLFGKRNKIEADTALAPADKQARLAELDKQLAALKN